MKLVIQSSTVIHARVLCATADAAAILGALPKFWFIKSSGPRWSGHHGYDYTRTEFIIERVINDGEDRIVLLSHLQTALEEATK